MQHAAWEGASGESEYITARLTQRGGTRVQMVGIRVAAVTMITLMIGWIAASEGGRTTWPDTRAVSVCGMLVLMTGRAWDAETARARRGGGGG